MSPDDPRHGTPNGYNAHRAAGEPACRPCLDAHNDYNNAVGDDIALTGGRWIYDRRAGVMRWHKEAAA